MGLEACRETRPPNNPRTEEAEQIATDNDRELRSRSCLSSDVRQKMKIPTLIFLTLSACVVSLATSYEQKSLADLVAMADYIVVGKITKVAMFDKKGKEIKDPKARTGPGLDNELRLYVRVDRGGILKISKKPIPTDIVVPLPKMNHDELGHWKENIGHAYIFLLEADPIQEVYPIGSRRWDTEREEIEALIQKQKETPNRVAGSD